MVRFLIRIRSSHCRRSVRKGVLRNFAKFTGKYLHQSLFFNKVAGLKNTFFTEQLRATASKEPHFEVQCLLEEGIFS